MASRCLSFLVAALTLLNGLAHFWVEESAAFSHAVQDLVRQDKLGLTFRSVYYAVYSRISTAE
jgi:hypothetical protein